jgi:ferredoxin
MSKIKVKSDVYELLRQKMDNFPIGSSRSEDLMKFLRKLFTEEEAGILSNFNIPYMDSRTTADFSKTTGIPEKKVKEVFENLVKRGMIYKSKSRSTRTEYYALLPMVPGVFEAYFADRRVPDSDKAEAAKWFEHLYSDGWGNEIGASDYPWARVIPIEKSFSPEIEVLPYERVSEYINNASSLAVMDCACRVHAKNCDKPVEVCLTFDKFSDWIVESGIGRRIDRNDAERILDLTEKKGLVHTTNNSQGNVTFICNCCTCCCGILRGLSELRNPRAFAKSNYQPEIDTDTCKKCRTCVRACPFKALTFHFPHKADRSDERLVFNKDLCIGCGVCASACPNNAIKLVRVKNDVPEKNGRDAWMKVQNMRIH